jgi:type II secretory pathway pseudopilin PulG
MTVISIIITILLGLFQPNILSAQIKNNAVQDLSSISSIFDAAITRNQRPFTQTEAYLSRAELRKGIKSRFKFDYGQKYNSLVSNILEKERDNSNGYYVFYHGQKNDFLLFYDFVREFISQSTGKDLPEEFSYIRIPGSLEFDQELSTLLKQSFASDQLSAISTILLSVNLSLFGGFVTWGSDTFLYFYRNYSMSPPKDFWIKLLDSLHIPSHYYQELTDLLTYIKTEEGAILQIFIPKDKISQYVYLSKSEGIPLALPNARRDDETYSLSPIIYKDQSGITHTHDPRTIDPETYLEIYKNYPDAIDAADMNKIQARILITNDFLLNQDSGIKIYCHHMVSLENMKIYKKKLKDLVNHLLAKTCQPQPSL